jgi:hypothetical protein
MSIPVLVQPAPGWYPDPAGEATYRWWDGDAWTEGTHAGEQDARPGLIPAQLFLDPEPRPAPEPPAAAPPVNILSAPVPLVADPAPRPPAAGRTSPAKTRWSSLLLAVPFVYPFAVGMVVGLAYAGGLATNTTALAIVGGVVAVALLIPAWVFADSDRRELVARGYAPAPSLGWMILLPPVAYLIARRRVVGPSY